MIITNNKKYLSNIVITTAFGHSGGGLFPYTLRPAYKKLRETVIRTGTAVITKSSTPEENQGRVILFDPKRPWTIIPFLYTANKYIKKPSKKEMVNSYGLTNKGIRVHGEEMRECTEQGIQIVPNVFLFLGKKSIFQVVQEALFAAEHIFHLRLYYDSIVWNWSCPNSGEDLQAHFDKILAVRKAVKKRHPMLTNIDKMSPSHPIEFFEEMERDNNTIFDFFNTIAFEEVFLGKKSPIKNVPGGGGYSGPASKEKVFKKLRESKKRLNSRIIMGHAVDCEDDIRRLFGMGAHCVSTCKMVLQDTKGVIKLLEKYN